MASDDDPELGLDPRLFNESRNEHIALSAAFVIAYIALAALGRDVLFNHNVDANPSDDFVGAVLPYIRVATCALAILVVVASSGLTWALSKVPLMLAPFCLWTLISVTWADEPKDTLRAAFTLIAAWIAMPMIIHRIGVAGVARLLLHIIAWVCVASLFLAVFVPSIGRHTAADLAQAAHAGRWRGIFSHKNGLGPWAANGAILLLFYGDLMRAHPAFRWFAWLCAVCCLTFCGSATAMTLAGACGMLYFAMFSLRHLPRAVILLGALMALTLASVASFTASDVIFEYIGRDAKFSGRSEIWKFAMDYIAERPWTGYGYGSLGGPDFLERERMLFLQPIPGAESGYLTLVLESGVTGVVLFFGPFFASIRNGFQLLDFVQFEDRRAIELCLIILLSTLVEAFSETNALISTGYDGVICFGAYFSLLTAPGPPVSPRRRGFQTAESWTRHHGPHEEL